MRIVTHYAEGTGVIWLAVESRKYITSWCMSLLKDIWRWIKGERYEK